MRLQELLIFTLFFQCLDSKNFRQVIGIALECRRFDLIETAIKASSNVNDTLSYCMTVSTC